MIRFVILVAGVLALTIGCAKGPQICVNGEVCADDERTLYFQAKYDVASGRLKAAERKLEFLVGYLEKTKKHVGFIPYHDLAILKLRLRKEGEARRYAEKATPYITDPREAERIYYIFQEIGDSKKAFQIAEHFFLIFPSDETLFGIVTSNLLRKNEYEKLKKYCEFFVSHNPENFIGLSRCGSVMKKLGYREIARAYFEKLISLGFYDELYLKELVEIYKEQGEKKRAIELLREIDRQGGSVFVKRELVELLLEEGVPDEAVRYMSEITVEIPEPEVLFDWLRVLFRSKKYADVVQNIDGVMSVLKDDRRISELLILMKAISLHELERFEEAIREYDKLDESSEFYDDAVAGKINALRELDVEKALEYIRQIDDSKITPGIAHSILYVYREREDFLYALKMAEEFEKRFESKRNDFIYVKAILLYDMGDLEGALRQAEILLSENPSDPTYLNLKGYVLCEIVREEYERIGKMDHQRLEEAGELISKALRIKPDPYIKDSMGWYLFIKGEVDEAEKYIRDALSALPNDPVLNEHLADILLKRGEDEKALEIYRRSLEKGKPKGVDKLRIQNKLRTLEDKLNKKKNFRNRR